MVMISVSKSVLIHMYLSRTHQIKLMTITRFLKYGTLKMSNRPALFDTFLVSKSASN